MALTDLTGTEWVFNDVLDTEEQNVVYALNFQSNNENFTQLQLYHTSTYPNEMRYRTSSTNMKYVYENGWSYPLYKTISITDGADATNSTLITWLKANATWTNQPEGVSISYAGNEIASMSASGTKTLNTAGMYCTSDITIDYTRPGGGSGPVEEKDVNFYDYDGTLLYSYTAVEFGNLASLPANPTHAGLTAQGWNWTQAQINAQLAGLPGCPVIVGQMYTPTSGATEIDITLTAPDLSPYLRVKVDSGGITIDWGDGTTPETVAYDSGVTDPRYIPHTYASAGDYTISLTGKYAFVSSIPQQEMGILSEGSSAPTSMKYQKCIKHLRVFTGANYSDSAFVIGSHAFGHCPNLETVTLAKEFWSTVVSPYMFEYCPSLKFLVVPTWMAGNLSANSFGSCYGLEKISLPGGITNLAGSIFVYSYWIKEFTMPYALTTINAIGELRNVEKVFIPSGVTTLEGSSFRGFSKVKTYDLPSGLTTVGSYAFSNNTSLGSIVIPSSVTSIGGSAFRDCVCLGSVNIPSGITTINTYTFYGCFSLSSIEIPSTVTKINDYAFYNCIAMPSITVPSSVTSIGTYAFAFSNEYSYSWGGNNARKEYHMLRTTPPTLSNKNAFDGNNSDIVIYVPYSADHSVLNAYKTASNWSNYATKMQEEPQP